MNPIIHAVNLTKSYGNKKALDGLSFDIAAGEFLGFLGPNGAGKTTTIRILTGIIKTDEGHFTIDGPDLPDKRQILGVMPESRGFYPWMTPMEYLGFFADLYRIPGKEQATDILLSQVGLSAQRNSRIGTFSRGMKQRLSLARALCNKPKILFLDEPTLGLDPQGQEDIQNLFTKLHQQGITIFLSSHLLDEVAQLCSRVVIIHHGRLVAQGSLAELQVQIGSQNSTLKDIFLTLTKA